MIKQTFIRGTMILLAAGIINRIMGFVPRIMLPRLIGAEGVGLYQMGYPLLIVILTVITGGIPLAVAKLVAEAESQQDESRIKTILTMALRVTVVLSLFFMVLSLFAAKFISTHLLTDSRVYYTFIAMTPIILFAGVCSVYRGYFQGRHNMIPTAISQIVETIIRILMILWLALMLLPFGIEFAAAGAMLGVVAGELGGLLIVFVQYKKHRKQIVQLSEPVSQSLSKLRELKHLMRITFPVTASRLIGSGAYFLESIMIVQSLAIAGVATAIATAQYGALQGMVIPIILLPSALTYSLSVSLVPSLSEAAARNDLPLIRKRLQQSIKLSLITGAPFAVLMFVLAEPLCQILYRDAEVGKLLQLMAPVALFIYVQGPLQAALQALDKPRSALLNTFIGACFKLSLIYLLASKPELGIYGALIAICINVMLVTTLHWSSVSRFIRIQLRFADICKLFGVMLAMAFTCYSIQAQDWITNEIVKFMSAASIGFSVFIILAFILGLIDRYDLVRIPWIGRKLLKRV